MAASARSGFGPHKLGTCRPKVTISTIVCQFCCRQAAPRCILTAKNVEHLHLIEKKMRGQFRILQSRCLWLIGGAASASIVLALSPDLWRSVETEAVQRSLFAAICVALIIATYPMRSGLRRFGSEVAKLSPTIIVLV